MRINIYEDKMSWAYLFSEAVLYSREPIPREDVPVGVVLLRPARNRKVSGRPVCTG